MMMSPGEFAARTSALSEGRPAPESRAPSGGDRGVRVLAARASSDGRDLHVVTTGEDATDRQRSAFEQAREHWLAHATDEEIAPILAHGDTPRPWLAVEPTSSPTVEQLPPETVRAIMVDLAEAVWRMESTGTAGELRWDHLRLDPTTGSARLCWPLTVGPDRPQHGSEWVCAVGYKLLTGTEYSPGSVSWPGDDTPPQLWHIIESVLRAPSPRQSCYELKRALLFGPATPPSISRPVQPDPQDQHDDETQPYRGSPLSRRAAVGVLGLGALGVTGLLARGTDTTSPESSAEETGPPDASFSFSQQRTSLVITHEGGDEIRAGRLIIRNPRISGSSSYRWSDYKPYNETSVVEEGDSIEIERGVLSMWFVYVAWESPTDEKEVVLEERKISEEDDLYS